jgi:hypothetical protein
MVVSNTTAYCDKATITTIKSFIVQAPGVNSIRLLFALLRAKTNKLDCFTLASFLQDSLLFPNKG